MDARRLLDSNGDGLFPKQVILPLQM
nr:hypothetical protein [Tanacetum cinerariifolium]